MMVSFQGFDVKIIIGERNACFCGYTGKKKKSQSLVVKGPRDPWQLCLKCQTADLNRTRLSNHNVQQQSFLDLYG